MLAYDNTLQQRERLEHVQQHGQSCWQQTASVYLQEGNRIWRQCLLSLSRPALRRRACTLCRAAPPLFLSWPANVHPSHLKRTVQKLDRRTIDVQYQKHQWLASWVLYCLDTNQALKTQTCCTPKLSVVTATCLGCLQQGALTGGLTFQNSRWYVDSASSHTWGCTCMQSLSGCSHTTEELC